MNNADLSKLPGHWLLAKMGKRVLRPGGRELSDQLIKALNINNNDHIVEFAPGLGATAKMILKKHLAQYTGIEGDKEHAEKLKTSLADCGITIIHSDGCKTPLKNENVTKVFGEAVLTMLADHRKAEMIREAGRILKSGGLYAIHEIELTPDTISEEKKMQIQKELALAIRVNARPLTQNEWKALFEKEGFKIKLIKNNSMHLLKTWRMVQDEGFFRSCKIGFNICVNPSALKRVMGMRAVFNKYSPHLRSILLVAEKN